MKPALFTQMSTGPDLALRPWNDLGERRAVRDVDGIAARRPAAGDDLVGRLGRALSVQVEDDELAALRGQREAVLLAEASRPARDQCHLARDAEVHQLARSALR